MTTKKRISLGVGSLRLSADGEDIRQAEWTVKLVRLFNSKSLTISVRPAEPEMGFSAGESRYEMIVDEYKTILFLFTHLRTEKYGLVLAEGNNLKERVAEVINEIYAGNRLKRLALLRVRS
jgi:hypothetical protein